MQAHVDRVHGKGITEVRETVIPKAVGIPLVSLHTRVLVRIDTKNVPRLYKGDSICHSILAVGMNRDVPDIFPIPFVNRIGRGKGNGSLPMPSQNVWSMSKVGVSILHGNVRVHMPSIVLTGDGGINISIRNFRR